MKSFLTILITMLLLPKGYGQGPWIKKYPLPGNDSYTNIHFSKNGQNGIAVSNGLNHLITRNGGQSWSSLNIFNTSFWGQGSYFISDSVGFNLKSLEAIYRTKDGGLTWSDVTPTPNPGIQYLTFCNPLFGYARSNLGRLKTQDGGLTWSVVQNAWWAHVQEIAAAPGVLYAPQGPSPFTNKMARSTNDGVDWEPVELPTSRKFSVVYFFDNQHGWAMGDSGIVARTLDGGTNWSLYFSTGLGVSLYTPKIQFIDPLHGWCSIGGDLFKTGDGGITWSNINYASYQFIFGSFHFISPSTGWLVGQDGYIKKTTDGGATWNFEIEGVDSYWSHAALQGNNRIWVTGSKVMYTDDKGESFTKVNVGSSETKFQKLQWVNPAHGYLLSYGAIFKTDNGGNTWQAKQTPGFASHLHFLHPDTGWVYGNQGVARTTDGGHSWETGELNNLTGQCLIAFSSDSMLTSILIDNGQRAAIVRSTDGGLTFPDTIIRLSGLINAIDFLKDGHIWIITTNGLMFRSNNYGIDWSQDPTTFGNDVMQMSFNNPQEGFLISGSTLYRTLNGGVTWQPFGPGLPAGFLRLNFVREGGKPVFLYTSKANLYINGNWGSQSYFSVGGAVVRKLNSNCTVDSGEAGIPERVVVAEPGSHYGVTDGNGRYSIWLDSGSYQIRQVNYHPLETSFCPPPNQPIIAVVGPQVNPVPEKNFVNEVKLCPILVLDQIHNAMRPCRSSFLTVTIQNQGNIPSDSEYVHVKFPPHLYFLSASSIYDYNAIDSTYRFKIPPIQPFAQYTISILDSVACLINQLTGQTLCVKATIPNVPSCLLQSPNWDGSDLEVASECLQTGQTRFKIHNKGESMAAISNYQIFIDSLLVYQAAFQLAANSNMNVTLPANAPAGFVRLVVQQPANHPLSTFASAEANCATGQSTNGIFPPPDQSPLVDIECVIVTNALDPNDKTVYPSGWGTAGNVEPETEFKYTIRFQNTGTDTAFKVVLADTLDQNLDIASLQIGTASHPYQFNVSGKGRPVLTWTFDNILLPDSGANMEKSNGFVSFSIRPKTGLPLGTRLENFADIYFDFNDPVRTNTTVNTLWRPTFTPGVLDTVFVTGTNPAVSPLTFSLFPNPSKGLLEVNSSQKGDLQVFDLQGVLVEDRPVVQGKNTFNFSALAKGMYILKITSTMGVQSRKLVLE